MTGTNGPVDVVHLLGSPVLQHAGQPVQLRGRKAWGLLTYLLLSKSPHTREHLAELLFPDADDPLRALRWNLTEIRQATGFAITGDPVIVSLEEDVVVDVDVLKRARWEEAVELPGLGEDLLVGFHLDGNPIFETWLLVQRREVKAASKAILREGALAALAGGDHETAIDLAARLVAIDPLHEASQALLIRSYVSSGDPMAAARQAEACAQLLQRELGVDPGAEVTSALAVSPASATSPSVGGRSAARAQLEAGRAAVRAGAQDSGIDCLRRAVAEAHVCGDASLKAETLYELGTALIHSGRNLRTEGAAALHEAMTLAGVAGGESIEAGACFELAWVDLLDARYDRAILWLDRAEARPLTDRLAASVMWVRGKVEMEIGHYGASVSLLKEAADTARRAGDVFRHGFALASLGRTHLMLEELDPAAAALRASLDVLRDGAPVLVPLAEGFLAQVYLLRAENVMAHELAEHAYAFALETGDVSMIAIAARALSLADAEQGRPADATARLVEVRRRWKESPDHTWTYAYALDALCGIAIRADSSDAPGFVDEMTHLVGTGPMPEMSARALLHRDALGAEGAASAAAVIAVDVDNPALHRLTAASSASTKPVVASRRPVSRKDELQLGPN